ncbi:hypothetical protein HPP92_021264 [Vanilla planifolia]|uniref:glycerophosphodiester phosphodiesterase n=2 Tax=Vanilla planifolia TaxID=51239 RepID=A0A835UIL6_VANPL|nr:hypothetical protein HPP92_021264 [Vanilla planifolia]
MALKAVHVSDVLHLNQVPQMVSPPPSIAVSSCCVGEADETKEALRPAKFLVIGHRGKGMNRMTPVDARIGAVKENTLVSFNLAGEFPVDFVEFDVQVTRDGCPIIFHDNFILTQEDGEIIERRTTELSLEEFLSYGQQRTPRKLGKPLLRKTKEGTIYNWNVDVDDTFCTLQEAFQNVNSHLGFNVELKFDDGMIYTDEELTRVLNVILQVVSKYADGRPVIFSSFQPDAAQLMRKLQSSYPVFFLTNGGSEIYKDVRRNSLDEAIKLCLAGGLNGIVSEVKAIFKNPSMIHQIKESNLGLLTYGQLNNVPEAVYMQHLMGVKGVIVDLVQEITEVVREFISLDQEEGGKMRREEEPDGEEVKTKTAERPRFTRREIAFLLKLIPELVQH